MMTEPPLVLIAAIATLVDLARTTEGHTTLRLASSRGLDHRATRLLLQRLGRAGLVRVTRGRNGGVWLAAPPGAISLHDVVAALADPIPPKRRAKMARVAGARPHLKAAVLGAFAAIDRERETALRSVTIESVVRDAYEILDVERRRAFAERVAARRLAAPPGP